MTRKKEIEKLFIRLQIARYVLRELDNGVKAVVKHVGIDRKLLADGVLQLDAGLVVSGVKEEHCRLVKYVWFS